MTAILWIKVAKAIYDTTSVLYSGLHVPGAFLIIIPPATKLVGVYWIHPVCPSVRLSVNISCPPCSIYSSGGILSIFGTNDQ